MSKKRKLPSNIYKKGQCVPRWLVRVDRKKFQHKLKFGCDVELIGKRVFMLSVGSGFFVADIKGVFIEFSGVIIDGSRLNTNINIGVSVGNGIEVGGL